jgi:cytochrome c-type biogenesis protein CcmH
MTMRRLACALALLTFAGISAAYAVQPDEMLADPKLEARARALSAELRCMVCQNQSIDDSDAPLAHDIRVLVRERLSKGDSEQAIKDFLVSRYGEFVLLKPPLQGNTLLLWGAPPILVLIGAGSLLLAIRRRKGALLTSTPLSAAEQREVATLMDDVRS